MFLSNFGFGQAFWRRFFGPEVRDQRCCPSSAVMEGAVVTNRIPFGNGCSGRDDVAKPS